MRNTTPLGFGAPDSAMNLTPMIDIVFILLIFFMVINSQSKAEFEDLSLPISPQGAKLTNEQVRAKLVFTIDPQTQTITLEGRALTLPEARHRVALAIQNNPRTNVVIRNSQQAECGKAGGSLLTLCADLGVHNTSLAVLSPQEAAP